MDGITERTCINQNKPTLSLLGEHKCHQCFLDSAKSTLALQLRVLFLWPSAGKDLISWLYVFLYAVVIVCVPSPSGWCFGQHVEFDCIGF